ncbi:non-homologous end-joining DNA ligase [Paenibacillus sp. GCM10027626]|uniref:non-homologous end-joining DNA ligase n=1 Tax=Paenibacillus sp. GCM10027626 TaxID=3273411 RepID=UPI003643E0AF
MKALKASVELAKKTRKRRDFMTAKLSEYNQKRNFERTLEPEGKTEASEEGLRFVVQHHMARREHYDLRLEWAGVLLSWAVPKGPSYDTRDKRLAVMVEDHPLEYRNFEGTIPKGEYGGGVVMLWDEGFWEPQGNVEEGLLKGELKFVLRGKRLKGKWVLIRWNAKAGEKKDHWLLLKEKDEHVKTDDRISEFSTSIRTGRTMAEIEAGEEEKIIRNPFNRVEVQLVKLVNTIPKDGDWLYELKYDGYRIVAFVEGNNVRLITRNGNDYAKQFHHITSSLIDLAAGRAMVLDGEIAITDESGKTDFQALQNYMKNPKVRNLTYIVFDLLALDGADLRGQRLSNRKEMLETLMKNAPKNLYYSRHIRGNGKESFAAACEAGMEGIIGKKADSCYNGTRNGDWIKLKCDKRQEFVSGEYPLSDKKTTEDEIDPRFPAVEVERSIIATSNSIMIEGIKITNPDKVLFDDPVITKEDVILYYAKVSEQMLPYVSRRILTIVRCPRGISQTCFYKKHPGPESKGVVPIPITTSSGKTEDYFYIENLSGLISEAQMGSLEFHIWGSCINELEKPDMMVFDLDPDEGMELGRVRQGARDMKSILAELSLNSYLKTSGGKGYHVVVPLKPVMSWDTLHGFARRVAEVMEQKWPDRYTSNARKANRAGKIFIDWIRNGRGATSIAPYSIRARKGAKVSMPIAWDELDIVAPDGINMADALLRSGGHDPWKDFFQNN